MQNRKHEIENNDQNVTYDPFLLSLLNIQTLIVNKPGFMRLESRIQNTYCD